MSFDRGVAILVASGHSRQDIFDHQQPDLPYRGWSVLQYDQFLSGALWLRGFDNLTDTMSVWRGIDLAFDSKGQAGKQVLNQFGVHVGNPSRIADLKKQHQDVARGPGPEAEEAKLMRQGGGW